MSTDFRGISSQPALPSVADAFASDDYYQRITGRPKLSSEGNMAQAIKAVAYSAVQHWKQQN